jgi:tetratricopeptide (TPR) repeat protein
MAGNRNIWALLLGCGVLALPLCAQTSGQAPQKSTAAQTGQTVRRIRVPVEEQGYSPAVARAEAAMERKDYAAAQQALEEAVQHQPQDYRAWFDLGFVLHALGRTPEAITAYRKSVAAKPDVFESNLNLGLLLAGSGDPEAEKYLRAATRLKPTAHPEQGQARAWLSLGHVLEKSDPKAALEAFRHAAELRPEDAEPHLSAGMVAERLGDTAAAEKEYQAASERDPHSREALAGLINVYMKTARYPQAESALRRYVAAGPQNATAHIQLGRVLAAQDKLEEALAELEAGLKLDPSDADGQRELAALYARNRQYDKAEGQYRALVQKDPNRADLHYGLGNSLLQQKRFPEAQAELLSAVRLKPDLADAYAGLALAASENKDYGLAIRALDARGKMLPEEPFTLFLRATSYDHLRDYKQAAAYYHQFLEAARGRFPEQEWQARHRLIAIEPKK